VGDLQALLAHAALATTGIYLKANPNYRRAACMRSGFVEFKKIDSMEDSRVICHYFSCNRKALSGIDGFGCHRRFILT
jgi:hypothetical protein